MPKELDVVRLRDGRKGTVVFVYRNGVAYEIEFADPPSLINVGPEDIVEVIYEAPESTSSEPGG